VSLSRDGKQFSMISDLNTEYYQINRSEIRACVWGRYTSRGVPFLITQLKRLISTRNGPKSVRRKSIETENDW